VRRGHDVVVVRGVGGLDGRGFGPGLRLVAGTGGHGDGARLRRGHDGLLARLLGRRLRLGRQRAAAALGAALLVAHLLVRVRGRLEVVLGSAQRVGDVGGGAGAVAVDRLRAAAREGPGRGRGQGGGGLERRRWRGCTRFHGAEGLDGLPPARMVHMAVEA